jgi:hypothetical protein
MEMSGVMALGWLVAGIFSVLSLLHIFWALGGRAGNALVLPERDGQPLFRPGPISTLLVAALLAVSALFVAQRAGIGPVLLPSWLVALGCWGVSAAFLLRAVGELRYVGFFKRVRNTSFARMDTLLYSPLSLCLGVGTGMVAFLAP